MPYTVLALKDLVELKTRRGTSTNLTMATVLGLNYPTGQGYAIYNWDDTSTVAGDDVNIVVPNVLPASGRWFRINYDQFSQIQCDWNATTGKGVLLNKPTIPTVPTLVSAFTNDAGYTTAASLTWSNISGKPTDVSAFVNDADYATMSDITWNNLASRPDMNDYYLTSNPDGYITGIDSTMVQMALGYAPYDGADNPNGYISGITGGDITWALGYTPVNPAAVSVVGFSGLYSDLLSKPVLSPVATSGSYNDLFNKPTIPTVPTNVSAFTNDAGYLTSVPAQTWASITGKPTFATVATTGAYADLTGKPTIYSFTGTGAQYTKGDGTYATFPTAVSAFSNDAGYLTGITSGQITSALGFTPYNGTTNPNGYLTSISSGAVISALGYTPINPNGTNTQYIAGDGTKITFPTIPAAQVSSDWNSVSGVSQILNKPVIPAQVSLTQGAGISITGSYPNLTITNTLASSTINNGVARTFNNNYTISSTRSARVYYTITLTAVTPLLAGSSTAQVFLEYSTNAGSSWIQVSDIENTQTVLLTVSVAITMPQKFVLCGEIPANALVRLRSNLTGGGTATYVRGQEVLV